MVIAVCGYSRHGKDTVCKLIAKYTNLRYQRSSSEAAALLVHEKLRKKYNYSSVRECFADRHNHKDEWASIIWKYNAVDCGVRLYRDMLETHDILNGIRDRGELQSCVMLGLVDRAIWVDATERLPIESFSSCNIAPSDCDYRLDNNGAEVSLPAKVIDLLRKMDLYEEFI